MKILFFFSILVYSFLHASPPEEVNKCPIAFSIAREDALQDLAILKRYFPEEKISMLLAASGSCTAAQFAAEAPLSSLTLVDSNLAQLALAKFKIHLLTLPLQKRQEILGYFPMKVQQRKALILGLMQALDIKEETFGDIELISQVGIDFIGRYEKVFESLRMQLSLYQKELEVLFSSKDIEEQLRQIAPETAFGRAFDQAVRIALSEENIKTLVGDKERPEFAQCFLRKIRAYLSRHLASSSPWLAHMLLGHFYKEVVFPWLSNSSFPLLPTIQYSHGQIEDVLEKSDPETYDAIHLCSLSNIAKNTLLLAHRALKPGGIVILRQLSSNKDAFSSVEGFTWDKNEFPEDRSLFYSTVFVGTKPKPSVSPRVKALADAVLEEIPVIQGSFFQALPKMSKEEFQKTQLQFFFAVDYFSRPMSALIARLPMHRDRIDILHNIVEEHGDFSVDHYHINTFQQFLRSIGIAENALAHLKASPGINIFNYTLMGVSANEDPIMAIACNGIIEYAFADISTCIGRAVVERGWVKQGDLIHYGMHGDIDKRHAEEFFKIIEPYMQDPEGREKILSGLKLGAYLFNNLYEDLYREARIPL